MEIPENTKKSLDSEIKKISENFNHTINSEKLLEMAQLSIKAKENSYSPYSKFRVGSCLLTAKGNLYLGTNVENISYGLTICAERSAVCNAVANGEKKIVAAVVTTDMDYEVSPCGACRQVLVEFGIENCFMLTVNNELSHLTSEELLPSGCKINHLKNK